MEEDRDTRNGKLKAHNRGKDLKKAGKTVKKNDKHREAGFIEDQEEIKDELVYDKHDKKHYDRISKK